MVRSFTREAHQSLPLFPPPLTSLPPPSFSLHLHAAVRHRHGVVRQRVAGHLAVVGAADGRQGAHVAGGEGISLVRPAGDESSRRLLVRQLGRVPTGELGHNE